MSAAESQRIGYVLKRYPRYSETFIVNEILAHEAAGLEIEIFALRPPSDTHFQDRIARVRASVTYVPSVGFKMAHFWAAIREVGEFCPHIWEILREARHEDVRDVYQAIWLARQAAANGITHLHAHFGTVSTTVARIAARILGLEYSFTAHAKDIFHEDIDTHDLRRKLADAGDVITVSDYNLAYLRDRFESDAGAVRRVYNGLDLSEFEFDEPDGRPPRIIAVGRLVEKKGFGDLIRACHVLKTRNRPFECSIVGAGELEADLRALIARHSLETCVEIAGPQPQSEVIQRIRQSAVMAAPCVIGSDDNRDGLPTVLLEAMAIGTPCISTSVTGIPEVIQHERTGLMVPQHDPTALADAIERLIDDRELSRRMARAARQRIESDFDIHRNAAEIRQGFRSPKRSHVDRPTKAFQEVS